ncbi:MAG: sigma 54-interacting transcriptional regulator [Magnetococcales bacterium]|nr:sigma 54-interacting transcriptional regulator [Magnetococcales bacterium]
MTASVLIVDDDELVVDMTGIVMARSGHTTTHASSTQQALERISQYPYDLVITDLRLPDGSGLEILERVKRFHPRMQVILITGFPDFATVHSALRAGAFDYLVKPVQPSEMMQVVQRALENRRIREERELFANRLAAVFQGVDDAILVMDNRLRIVQLNDAASQLLGLTATPLHDSLQNVAPWLFAAVETLLHQARMQGSGKRAVCMVPLREKNQERLLSCTASVFQDPASEEPGTILVVRDESRLHDMERKQDRLGRHGLVGACRLMRELHELMQQVAQADSTVLISGETGTGKELVARALHETSPRARHPFVAVNCAALPAGLLESELFGHVRGAFTHALRDKTGRFQQANGGTIFLDEIGDLPMEMQVKLLRILQTHQFEVVGESRSTQVDVRVMAATHRNLRKLVLEGMFREDLFYRLKVVELNVPPLRERKADLPLLIDHFLMRLNSRMKRSVKGISDEVLTAFMDHDWPGNVRELEHLLEHAMVVARQPILTLSDLPPEFRNRALPTPVPPPDPTGRRGRPLKHTPPTGEKPDEEAITRALTACRWRIQETAQRLGISRSTLWRRMRAMGLKDQPRLLETIS